MSAAGSAAARRQAPAAARRLYDDVAARASRTVLRRYSSSFWLGTLLLDPARRSGIEAVYGLVRVADEVVDTHAGTDDAARRVLDDLHRDALAALRRGWSANVVVHSFARVARAVGIGPAQIDPFFDSMRMDLDRNVHDRASFDRYVHGSAEVVGEMCLAVFLNPGRPADGVPRTGSDRARCSARALGAAFQKVNFLRDLGADHAVLGRSYFPGLVVDDLAAPDLLPILEEIDADLDVARAGLDELPPVARRAVATTIGIYAELLKRLRACAVEDLLTTRVRVPAPVKLRVALSAALGRTA